MRRFLFSCVLLFLFCFGLCFSYQDCDYVVQSCSDAIDLVSSSSLYIYLTGKLYINDEYYYLVEKRDSICTEANSCLDILKQQKKDVSSLMSEGYNLYRVGDYEKSIDKYYKAMDIIGDATDENYKISEGNIISCYQNLGSLAMKKEQRDNAVKYYNFALKIDNKNDYSYYGLGVIRFEQKDYDAALGYFKKAFEYSTHKDVINSAQEYMDYINFMIEEEKKQKNSISSDFFSYRTLPFLEMNNIVEAWQNVNSESNEVVVAIVDDGIYVNHPDLSENIWVNSDEIPNNGIDDDKNGYKDDFNGWNFVYNNNNLLPLGTHGTMVAGIIGAVRDNDEGIAGIVKNVKLMPIGVCGEKDCSEENIIAGINYAIDNGANIINISLGGSQFNFTNNYNQAIKRAYNHGIVVVIAAGNGDILTDGKNGINTTVNPLSPVCNYGDNEKSIIGVGALNLSGQKAEWSNYGNCVNFWALGEDVFSTVMPAIADKTGELYNQMYNFGIGTCDYGAGTSFSTPIIAGIVGLGYNKYGFVSPDIVRDSLKKSMGTGYLVDADEYLEILGNLTSLQTNDKIPLKERFQEWRYNLKKKLRVFFDGFKKSENVIDSLNSYNSSVEDYNF